MIKALLCLSLFVLYAILCLCEHVQAVETICKLNGHTVQLGLNDKRLNGIMKCVDQSTGIVQEEQEFHDGKPFGHHMFRRNDISIVETTDERGRTQGPRKWFRNDKLTSIVTYKDGEIAGLSQEFLENGKPKEVSWTDDDSWHSLSFEVRYLEDGKITHLLCNENSKPKSDLGLHLCGYGEKPSKVDIYNYDGTLGQTVFFQNGKQIEKTSFSNDGKISSHEVLQAGTQKVSENYPDGKLKAEAEYKDHCLNGIQKEFHASGKLVRKTTWEMGQMTSEEEYYLNGNVKFRAQRKKQNGTWLVARQSFADNAQLIEDGVFAEKTEHSSWMGYDLNRWNYSVRVGLHREFTESGVLVLSEAYDSDGNLEGISRSYYPDSKPRSESSYEKNILQWRKTWDRSGKLIEDDEFFEDGSRKSRMSKPNAGV